MVSEALAEGGEPVVVEALLKTTSLRCRR